MREDGWWRERTFGVWIAEKQGDRAVPLCIPLQTEEYSKKSWGGWHLKGNHLTAGSRNDITLFFETFFRQLIVHLHEKNWLEDYLQHIGDEKPFRPGTSNYEVGRIVHRILNDSSYYPEGCTYRIKTLDATHRDDASDVLDIWIPELQFWPQNHAYYEEAKENGAELWFYNASSPTLNRFIHHPFLHTRQLHWVNFRYGLKGYLHWGYNVWTDPLFAEDPYVEVPSYGEGRPNKVFGTLNIVYPDPKDRVTPVDSIRFEMMRAGIDDNTLLYQLHEKDPGKAERLVRSRILGYEEVDTDIVSFRRTRHALLSALDE
ncbi:MAG: DUF4091 domain-containing protein [Lentisphaerae bacterium]|nr:DUF4091 domain-containing protein [Lentisphaerota bacterium]MBT5608320.1 DUF4091 domain-containing protein [Lentisphaerota bacterium]MBT7840767.1 DUF4091 domain-containing protein [Lentisphaerota bacterium]